MILLPVAGEWQKNGRRIEIGRRNENGRRKINDPRTEKIKVFICFLGGVELISVSPFPASPGTHSILTNGDTNNQFVGKLVKTSSFLADSILKKLR